MTDFEQYRKSVDFKQDLVDLGILINRLREYKGLTMRELSAMSHVSSSKICDIEDAKISPTIYTISKLCRAMGYSVSNAYGILEAMSPSLENEG